MKHKTITLIIGGGLFSIFILWVIIGKAVSLLKDGGNLTPFFIAIGIFVFIGIIIAFLLRGGKIPEGGADVVAKIITHHAVIKAVATAIAFFAIFYLIDVIAVKNAVYLSLTWKAGLAALFIGSVLLAVILLLTKGEDPKQINGFVKGVCGLMWAVFFIAFSSLLYSYYRPRYFDPEADTVKAERMIDPSTYEDFPLEVKHNPETGVALRLMTPDDVEKVEGKRKHDLSIIREGAKDIVKGIKIESKPKKNKANDYFGILEITRPVEGSSVQRGSTVTIVWDSDIPPPYHNYFLQFNYKDINGWSKERYIDRRKGFYDWKVPLDIVGVAGSQIQIFLGIHNDAGKWVSRTTTILFVY